MIKKTKTRTYVQLSIKSNFSFFRGGSHSEEYAHRALNLGLKSFAITGENSVSGIVRARRELKKKATSSTKNNCSFLNTRITTGTKINSFENLTITALAKNC